MTSRSRTLLALHRLVLRTSRTPLRAVWAAAYRALGRAWAAYLARGERGASAYIRASLANGDFLPGLSDLDVAVVLAPNPAAPGAARERASERWQRLRSALGPTDLLLDYPFVFEEPELLELTGTSALTYGLEGSRPGYTGHADRIRVLERPGLYGLTAGWRRLSGPDRRPVEPPLDADRRRIAAWLELVYWWQWVFPVCVDPSGPRTAHLCVKLVAEPARIWLWLAHGERLSGRTEVLRQAARRLPEEEPALRRALDLQRRLADSPAPPLAETIPVLVRLSARIARCIEAEVWEAGATEVRLLGGRDSELVLPDGGWTPDPALDGGQGASLLALCDWRSLTLPWLPDESFAPLPGDPRSAAVLGAAARHEPGPFPALRADRLLILPAATRWRTRLRAVQCPVTDPVSFALLDGSAAAAFPRVPGWSAGDLARRAVAEHRDRTPAGEARMELGALLVAARAALLLESLEEGDPELAVTVSATARRLADRHPPAQGVAEEALGRYRDLGADPPEDIVSRLRQVVLELAAYRSADRRAPV